MGEAPGRAGWLLAGAALTTFAFIQALRVWFPTVLFVVGDAGETSAAVMGGFALLVLLVGPLAAVVFAARPLRLWLLGAGVLVVGHGAFLFTSGGLAQAVTATAAVIGGAMALTILAGLPVPGTRARSGIVLGLATEVSVHAALGSHTLAWRSGPAATLTSLAVLVLLLVAVRGAIGEVRRADPDLAAAGRAWPWSVLAPLFLLVLVIAAVPGRTAVATSWDPALVTVVIVGGQALVALAVVLAPRLTPIPAAAAGGALTLVGATAALEASGIASALAQGALAVGLALIAVREAPVTDGSPPRRRVVAAGGGLFGFGVLAFLYYAAYDLHLGFYNRAILLLAAAGTAVLAAAAARARATTNLRPAIDRRRLIRIGAALAVIVAASGAVRLGDAPPEPAPGVVDEPLRVMLYNVHMGYDVDGRFAVEDLAEVIRLQQPDIVLLNEVDRGWLTTGGHDLLQLLVDELGMNAVFAPGADEVWGNALLTNLPVHEMTTRRLPRGNDPMPRGQLAAIVDVAPGRQLGVVGTHLSHIEDQGATRLPQARAVAGTVAWLHERSIPTVVLGDLNAEPDSQEIATFGSFVEPTLRSGNPTWPSWEPQVQIDHILVSPSIEVLEAATIASEASDHLPLVADILLPEVEAD